MTPTGVDPESIPEQWAKLQQWICWASEERDGKQTKVPKNPHNPHQNASVNDETTWGTFEEAIESFRNNDDYDGIGFVFSESDILAGIDLDDCRDPETGDIDSWARDVITTVDSYTEISPSGTGLHIITIGSIPDGKTRSGSIEMYDENRFFTVTGAIYDGDGFISTDIEKRPGGLHEVHQEYVKDDQDDDPTNNDDRNNNNNNNNNNDPDPPSGGVALSDDELITKAKKARNGDKFRRLFEGDTSGYESHSEADMAFVTMLAFWSGGDRQQMDRIFRDSGLMRGKWDEVHSADGSTYGEMTIDAAIEECDEYYEPKRADGGVAADPSPTNDPTSSPTNDDGDDDGDNQEEKEEEEIPSWGSIKELYAECEAAEDRKYPRKAAIDRLLEEESFLTVEESDTLLWWNGRWYQPRGEAIIRSILTDRLGAEYMKSEKEKIYDFVKGQTRVREEELGEKGLIPVENCVLEVDPDGITTHDHDPDRYFRKGVTTEYDPDAEWRGTEWQDFLQSQVPDPSDRLKLQEYSGYTLMHWTAKFQKALFIVGPKRSGKSTFNDVISHVLGDEATVSISPQEWSEERFIGAHIYGSYLNIRSDIPDNKIENTGKFKEMIAGDSIKAEKKFKEPFFFEPNCKHIYSANQLPSVENDDEAFYRRVILIPFPNSILKNDIDRDLDDRLKDLDSEVLNWMLEGLQRLLENGRFTSEMDEIQTQHEWESWGESVERFAAECLTTDCDPGKAIPKRYLKKIYDLYCESQGMPPETQRKLTRELKNHIDIQDGRQYIDGDRFESVSDGRHRCYIGLELTDKGEKIREELESDGDPDFTSLDDY